MGITPSYRNPYLNMVKIHNHKIKLINSKKNFIRRQDVPKVYDITTAIYISNRRYILNCKKIMEGKNGYIIVPIIVDEDEEGSIHKDSFKQIINVISAMGMNDDRIIAEFQALVFKQTRETNICDFDFTAWCVWISNKCDR